MSFLKCLEEELKNDKQEVLEEGMLDKASSVIKTGIKLIPALAMAFNVLASEPDFDRSEKDEIKSTLIQMQKADSKDMLDVYSQEVMDSISKLSGETRNDFIKQFQKAYKEVSKRL